MGGCEKNFNKRKIGFLLWGPPWDPGDVFKSFFDDFFGLLASKKGSFTPDPKNFYFWPFVRDHRRKPK